MTDFDYVGTGGFIIECENGETMGVTKEQYDVIIAKCEFFQNCFRHGTIESHKGVLQKPDWSVAIARHLVEVLTKGKTTLSTLELYEQLMAASDQALIDLRLCSMVNYMDPIPNKEHRFLELVDPSKYCFTFRAELMSSEWLELLNQDILLYRNETNYVVQFYEERVLDREKALSRRKLDTRVSDYEVHADQTISAIMKIQQLVGKNTKLYLNPQRQSLSAGAEQFSIYFETKDPIPQDHHQLIDRLAGGEAYIRTCADAVEYKTEGYTVRASFDVLARAVRPLKDNADIYCSVRIDNPTPDTLGRFVNACQKAKDYPSTLGLDSTTNRFFCKKTIQDVWIILEYMADFSTKSKIDDSFQLFELSSEDKPF